MTPLGSGLTEDKGLSEGLVGRREGFRIASLLCFCIIQFQFRCW